MNPTNLDDALRTYREHVHRHYGGDVTELLQTFVRSAA
jgi:hypothetical protein